MFFNKNLFGFAFFTQSEIASGTTEFICNGLRDLQNMKRYSTNWTQRLHAFY